MPNLEAPAVIRVRMFLVLLALVTLPGPVAGQVLTPFQQDVNAAIDDGVGFFRINGIYSQNS